MNKVKILVACHKPAKVYQDDVYKPIQVGKALHPDLDLGYITDATGDNISSKNGNYSELTAQYWAWKNLKDVEYIGLCHYRRYFKHLVTFENIDTILGNHADVIQVERLEESIETKKRRLSLLDMSLSYGLYPTEADLSGLQEFFPEVNLRKLYEVEGYHKKLASILDGQFAAERDSVQREIEDLQSQVASVNDQIRELGMVGNLSKEFLDRHSEIKGRIDALKTQNEAYLTLTDLQDARKKADDMLKSAIETILSDIEQAINDKMKEYNDSLFAERHKPPHLHFNEYNSYRFETPDDTGTGSNYKGMVIFDLAVLNLTALPAIAHDSLILKNISDGSIDGIMKIYADSKKQIFIAFDKQDAYTTETRKIVTDNKVLKLSDNHCELYGESWNVEEAQSENKL